MGSRLYRRRGTLPPLRHCAIAEGEGPYGRYRYLERGTHPGRVDGHTVVEEDKDVTNRPNFHTIDTSRDKRSKTLPPATTTSTQ